MLMSETCPYACYLDWGDVGTTGKLEEQEGDTNKYALVGIAFHKTMEDYGNVKIKKESITREQLHLKLNDYFNEIPNDMFDDEEDKMNFHVSVHEQLDYALEHYDSNSILATEWNFEPMEIFDGILPFFGTVDRIDGNIATKEVDLCDYKTGKVYTKKELASNIQACIYAIAFYKKHGFLPKRFIFFFTKHKKEKIIHITPEFLERAGERILDIYFRMCKKEFAPNDKNKYFCKNFCKHYKECPKFKAKKGWEEVVNG